MNILSAPRVYFQIDYLARDAITAAALKKHLQAKKIKLVYGNRILTGALFRFSLIHAFDIVILPRPMFIPQSFNGRAVSSQIMVLPTESIGRVMKIDRYAAFGILDKEYMEGDTSRVDRIDRFLLWGEGVRNTIVSMFPSLAGKLSVVGHPRLDELIARPVVPDGFTSSRPVKRVGLITRFPLLNPISGRPVTESIFSGAASTGKEPDVHLYHNHSTNDVLPSQNPSRTDELYKQSSDVFVLTEIMSRLIELGVSIDLKIHPNEAHTSWASLLESLELSNSVRLVDRNIPFSTWARDMDYAIGPASTSFYECINLGVTPICIKNIDEKRAAHLGPNDEEDTDLVEAIFCPSSIDELLDYVVQRKKLVITDDLRRILSRETMYLEARLSLSRVAEECASALRGLRRRNPWLKLGYYLLFSLFNRVYNARRKILDLRRRRTRVSTDWLLDRRTMAFVDSLLDTPDQARTEIQGSLR